MGLFSWLNKIPQRVGWDILSGVDVDEGESTIDMSVDK
jgi:hypothetical protein